MAQSLTPPSVSDLCARELPFGVLFEPETGLTLVVQLLVPSSWALVALEQELEVLKTALSAKELLPPQPARGGLGRVWSGLSSPLLVASSSLHHPLILWSLALEQE